MQRRAAIVGLLLTALVAALSTAAPIPGGDGPEPIYTQQRVFAIPFYIERPEITSQEAAEVQLHVSTDGGETWRAYDKADPGQRNFIFEAPRDGEYWFFVRTLGEAGGLYPQSPAAPEMKVVVDTLPPRLELAAERANGGEVVARWRIADRNLAADGFKLEYQTSSGPEGWQRVTVPPSRSLGSGRIDSGETAWVPQGAPGAITVRAEVVDRAGNVAVSQVRVAAAGGTTAMRRPPANGWDAGEGVEEIAPGNRYWAAEDSAAGPLAPGAVDRRTASTPPPMADRFPAGREPAAGSSQRDSGGLRAQAVRLPDGPFGVPAEEIPLGEPDRSTPRWDEQRGDSPVFNRIESYESGPSLGPELPLESTDVESLPLPPPDPIDASSRSEQDDESPDGFGLEMVPIGERPRFVNSRRFELEYEIESVGPSGLNKVELWGTRDGGRAWTSYGVDADKRSPMLVSVDGEGVFGFRIVAQSNSGLGGLPPRSGDLPEVWIGVDLTKPSARFLDIQLESPDRAGELVIPWRASDKMLADRPVSLGYSDRPDGPWTPIASGLDNTGRYVWRLDNNVPQQVYLRLEVRDEAGNVQIVVTDSAVSLDPLRPQGRIRNIRPVRDTDR